MAYALDYSNERVMNGTMTPVEAAQYLRGVTAILNKQRNITSSFTGGTDYDKTMNALFKGINKTTGISMSVTNSLINQSESIKRLQARSNTNVYYGNALDKYMNTKTTNAPRTLANILSKASISSLSKSAQAGAGYKGLTSAKGKSRGRSPSRPSDAVLTENAIKSLTGIGSQAVSDLSRLSGIDIMGEIPTGAGTINLSQHFHIH